MSTTSISVNSTEIDAPRFDPVSPEYPAEIEVEHGGASVVVKAALDLRDKQAAFRFLYEIYVEKEKLISPTKLPPKYRASKSLCDKWDRRPSTRHIVALFAGTVVGHVRLLYRKDGRLPTEEAGFEMSSDVADECEVSKLVLHPDFRRGDILAAFYRQIFQICRTQQRLTSVIVGCQPKQEALYTRIGAEPIGSFMNTCLGTPCTVMRITFVDEYDAQFRGGLLGRRHGKLEPAFLPSSEILGMVASQVESSDGITASWSASRLDGKDTENNVGVWRVVVGGQKAIAKVIRTTGEIERNDAEREAASYRWLDSHRVVAGICYPKLLATYPGKDATTLLLADMWTSQSRYLIYSDVVALAQLLGNWQASSARVDCPSRELSTFADYVSQAGEGLVALPALAEEASVLSPVVNGKEWLLAMHLWNRRDQILRTIADTPQAFAHQNLEAHNCIVQQESDAEKRFALISWARSCTAPVGCDLGPLVFGNSLSSHWSVSDAERIWRAALDSYIEGLPQKYISWLPAMVRRSAVITAVLRYVAWAAHLAKLAKAASGRQFLTRASHCETQEVVERYCAVRTVLLSLWTTEEKKSFTDVH